MQTLAQYIAAYIQHELNEGAQLSDIDSFMIQNAIDAYEGGAGECHALL